MRAALALVAIVASTGSLPKAGVLVPGRSLGGVHLGETAAQTRAALGGFYGTCDGCARTTWYFTYGKWTRTGLAVELRHDRVTALYTVWQPPGWHTAAGLRLGAVEGQVTSLAGPVVPVACAGYTALVRDAGGTRTAYYIVDGKLWGFGLMQARANPCRA